MSSCSKLSTVSIESARWYHWGQSLIRARHSSDAADLSCLLPCSLWKDDMHSRNLLMRGVVAPGHLLDTCLSCLSACLPACLNPSPLHRGARRHDRTRLLRVTVKVDVTLPRSRAEGGAAALKRSWGTLKVPAATDGQVCVVCWSLRHESSRIFGSLADGQCVGFSCSRSESI